MINVLIEMLQASNPLLIVVAGLVIGLIHAFEPDHISAVSTQVLKRNRGDDGNHYDDNDNDKYDTKDKRNSNSNADHLKKIKLKSMTISSSLRGVLWGAGHTSSTIIIGLLIAGLSLSITDHFFHSAEIAVGVMLIALGILTVRNKSILVAEHSHPHKHADGISHTHPHRHNTEHRHGHRSYIIGCIHGIAGSGSLVAVIASTMNSLDIVFYFLILFGIGSIIGMTLAGGVLGISFMLLPKIKLVSRYLRYVIAGITLIIGINIIFTVGFESKLFL